MNPHRTRKGIAGLALVLLWPSADAVATGLPSGALPVIVGGGQQIEWRLSLASSTAASVRMMFVTDPDGDARVLPSDVNNPRQNDDILVMDADGSHQSALTNGPHDDTAPAPSPDGTRVALTSNRDGNDEIYMMSRDGTAQADLSNNPMHPIETHPGRRTALGSSSPPSGGATSICTR